MDETVDKRTEDSLEYQRGLLGLFGDVAKVGFWGALFAGVMAIGARLFLGSDTGKGMIEDSYEAQLIAHKLGSALSFLGFDELYSESELEKTFLEDKTLHTLVSSQLTGTNIVIGEKTLTQLLDIDSGNRATTLALLKKQDFSVTKPSGLDASKIEQALLDALNGNAPAGVDAKELERYTGVLLQSIITDIKNDSVNNVGLLHKTRELLGSLTGDTTEREALGEKGDLLGGFLKRHTEKALELLQLVSEDEQLSSFLQNHQTALTELIDKLPQEDVTKLANLVFEAANSKGKGSLTEKLIASPKLKELQAKHPNAFFEFADKTGLVGNAFSQIGKSLSQIELPSWLPFTGNGQEAAEASAQNVPNAVTTNLAIRGIHP